VLIPIVVVNLRGDSFSLMGSMFVSSLYIILFTKLVSYVQVNQWCRSYQKQQKVSISGKRRESFSIADWERKQQPHVTEKRNSIGDQNGSAVADHQALELVQYPDNLSLHDLFYFLFAPTLCYELNFPRTTRIRKRFLIKRLLELVVGINIVMALFQQWMVPSVKNSLVPFSNMEFTKATERLLKLAVSWATVIWT
jgi:diacylglycerol O-acyltransferase 1